MKPGSFTTIQVAAYSLLLLFLIPITTTAQQAGDLLWSFEMEDENVAYSSPTVLDGVAYITDSKVIYAIDIATGDEIWSTEEIPENTTFRESASVVDGVLYIADNRRNVYALDIENGDILWKRDDEETSLVTNRAYTTVYGDILLVTTGSEDNLNNGWVRALDTSNGEMLWEYETVNPVRESRPVAYEGIVYAGDYVGNVYALDIRTGHEEWVFESSHTRVYSSPTVADGVVYVVISQVLPDDGTSDIPLYDGYLYALDAETGDEIWSDPLEEYASTGGARSTPTVHDGSLYVGIGFDLLSVDISDGSVNWKEDTGANIVSSPTIADGVVFVGSNDNYIYAFDAGTGDEEWTLETPYLARSSPVVVDGVLYIGADRFDLDESDTDFPDNDIAGYLYAVESGVSGHSQGSRIELATLNHHFGLTPFFTVNITSTNAPVQEEEALEVEVEIRNTGQQETQSIELEDFDGDVVDQADVTLDRNESDVITLTWNTSEGDAGFENITVRSEDRSDQKPVAIMKEDVIAGCGDITEPGYYTMNNSVGVNSTCITITSSYVVFDGNMERIEHITGGDVNGIVVDGGEDGIEHVTVKNIFLDDFSSLQVDNGAIIIENLSHGTFSNITTHDNYWGIWGENVSDVVFEDSHFDDDIWYGIIIENSERNVFRNLEINGPYYGFYLYGDSEDNDIYDNYFHSNPFAITIQGSRDIRLTDNRLLDNSGDFGDLGDLYLSHGVEDIYIENLHTGKTGESDLIISGDAKHVEFMSTESPGEHHELSSMRKYFMLEFTSSDAVFDIEIHYADLYSGDIDIEQLSLWRYDYGNEVWVIVEDATIDETQETISANITDEGTYGVFTSEQTIFQVDILGTNSPVSLSDQLVVEAQITNSGVTEGTQSIELLRFDGAAADSHSVSLAMGEQDTISLEWEIQPEDAGTGTVVVSSENTSDSTSVFISDTYDIQLITECLEITETATYYLDEDLTGEENCIQIMTNNVVVYGSGHLLEGTGSGAALTGDGIDSVSIIDLKLENWQTGIQLENVQHAVLNGNHVENSDEAGIRLIDVAESMVRENSLTDGFDGIVIQGGGDNHIDSNVVSGSEHIGIHIGDVEASSGNSLAGNSVSGSDELDFLADNDSEDNPVNKLLLGSSNPTEIQLSFDAKNIGLRSVSSAPDAGSDPSDPVSTGTYFELDAGGNDAYFDVDIHYEELSPAPEDEELLTLWQRDETGNDWEKIGDTTLDMDENTLSGNLTEEGIYGMFIYSIPTSAVAGDIPESYELRQNYPNPFNPATNITYALPETAHVRIDVYNTLGQHIKQLVNETQNAGWHETTFDASSLASGLYIYRIEAEDFVETRQMLLIK